MSLVNMKTCLLSFVLYMSLENKEPWFKSLFVVYMSLENKKTWLESSCCVHVSGKKADIFNVFCCVQAF